MENLTGKTAVITGAASGIGLAMAHHFGAEGMNLVLADIETDPLVAAADALATAGYEVLTVELDVRDLDQIKDLEAQTTARFGNVHVLCNNAGVGAGGPVPGTDDLERWKWTIDINLWGVIYGCKVFLPAMIEHGEGAHIVNTASMAGLGSAPFMGAYNISKYGVVALSETMSKELQLSQAPVDVSVLCPAFVQTGIGNSQRNMPAELQAGVSEDSVMSDFVNGLIAAGLPTDVIGTAVVEAVKNNKFWILTHPEHDQGIVDRANDIVSGVNPSAGMAFE